MMKKTTFLFFFSLLVCGLSAQLINDGGTIVIEPNAVLVVESDITNTSGTIQNSGEIQVNGNFTNSDMVTSSAGSIIDFTGNTDSNFDAGGSSFAVVRNSKTAGNVVLTNDVAVEEAVDFVGASKIVLGGNDVNLANGSTTNGSDATGWFVTDGAGIVSKQVDASETTTFDVGDATSYTPVDVLHSGTYTAGTSTVSAKVTPATHPSILADADAYISRYWNVDATGITNYSADLTGTYDDATDVTGTVGDIVGARYEGGVWEFAGGTGTVPTVDATTAAMSTELTGMNFFGKANITMFLEGPYIDGTDLMSNSINSLLPLSSPYSDAPATATSIPANAVDWVKVEIRDAADLTSVVSASSGFLMTNGTIVDVDGVNLLNLKNASANSHIAIFHRNHLDVLTANPVSGLATSVPTVNLSDGTTSLFTNGPAAAKTMPDGNIALYSGDSDMNGDINIDDLLNVWLPNNGVIYNTSQYNTAGNADFDLNGDININDALDFWIVNNSVIQQIPQ